MLMDIVLGSDTVRQQSLGGDGVASEIETGIKDQRLYYVGDRLPDNWFEAFSYWFPLAEGGDPKAQFNVGRSYETGGGVD